MLLIINAIRPGCGQDARPGKTTAFLKHAIYKRIDNMAGLHYHSVFRFSSLDISRPSIILGHSEELR
jgi:hypothetical protein